MKPRICILSITYDPFVGGAEVAIQEVTKRLPQYDFDIVTARLRRSLAKKEQRGNVIIHRIGIGHRVFDKYIFPWAAARRVGEWHRKKPYALVWAMMANYAGLAASFFKETFPSVPYVLTLQEGDSEQKVMKKTRWIKAWYKDIYRRADQITAISTHLSLWPKKYGGRGEDVTIIPNGVDIDLFTQTLHDDERRALLDAYHVHEDDRIAITVSRLVEKNGLEDLIDAMAYLPHHIKLFIVGEGMLEAELHRRVEEKKVRDRVFFFGHCDQRMVSMLLHVADVFVRPSRSEGLGNAFLEAMAVGIPVIGTPVGGIPDFLKEEETGYFCRAEDPQDIAKRIHDVLTDATNASRIAEQGKTLVQKKYSWNDIAKTYDSLFQSLIQ